MYDMYNGNVIFLFSIFIKLFVSVSCLEQPPAWVDKKKDQSTYFELKYILYNPESSTFVFLYKTLISVQQFERLNGVYRKRFKRAPFVRFYLYAVKGNC